MKNATLRVALAVGVIARSVENRILATCKSFFYFSRAYVKNATWKVALMGEFNGKDG